MAIKHYLQFKDFTRDEYEYLFARTQSIIQREPYKLAREIDGQDVSVQRYQRLVEGAWVHRRDGWYYLFYSGDNCCGPNAHYATLVARSRRMCWNTRDSSPTSLPPCGQPWSMPSRRICRRTCTSCPAACASGPCWPQPVTLP